MLRDSKLLILTNKISPHIISILPPHVNKDMILAIKNGDREAISLLYDAYAPAMYGRILKIIPHNEKAENILASLFINLSHTIKIYNAEATSLFIWLLNMATNKSIEALNIYRVKHDVKESSLQTNDATMTTYVNKLAIFERTIFSLIYFRGFNVNEIASLLQLPAKIIKKRFKLLHKF